MCVCVCVCGERVECAHDEILFVPLQLPAEQREKLCVCVSADERLSFQRATGQQNASGCARIVRLTAAADRCCCCRTHTREMIASAEMMTERRADSRQVCARARLTSLRPSDNYNSLSADQQDLSAHVGALDHLCAHARTHACTHI